jgi:hypothetical protein
MDGLLGVSKIESSVQNNDGNDGKESTYSSVTTIPDFMHPMYNPWLPRRPSSISINPANSQLQGEGENRK